MCCAGPGREAGRMTRQVTPFHFIGSRNERAAGERRQGGRGGTCNAGFGWKKSYARRRWVGVGI